MSRKVRATQTIKRDGELIKPGQTFVVNNAEAKRLEAYDAIEPKVKKEEAPVVEEDEETDDGEQDSLGDDYSKMRKADLVELGIQRGVDGASKLAKSDLVEILADQDKN